MNKTQREMLEASFSDQELITFNNIKTSLASITKDGVILVIKDDQGRIRFNDSFTQKSLNIKQG